MQKEEVSGSLSLPGGRGFGDRGTCIFARRSQVSLSLTTATARARRARWPDLKATAFAADPKTHKAL